MKNILARVVLLALLPPHRGKPDEIPYRPLVLW
jgi:hypothetical protein